MIRWPLLILILTLAGCYNGPGTDSHGSNNSVASSTTVKTPAGFTGLPTNVDTSANTYTGIYNDASLVEQCCWLEKDAEFETAVPPSSTKLVLTVRIPDLPVFHRMRQSVRVTVNGKETSFENLMVGTHRLPVTLSPSHVRRMTTVAMKMGFAFVPQAEHINSDTRKLSLYLNSVRSQ